MPPTPILLLLLIFFKVNFILFLSSRIGGRAGLSSAELQTSLVYLNHLTAIRFYDYC